MDKEKYKTLLDTRRKEYAGYTSVYCQCIREYVFFNSDGFSHLRFHVDGTPRNPKEQMYKLGLLPLVIPVIKIAKRVEQYERKLNPIGRKKKAGKKILKEIQYWALVDVVGKQNVKLKVILRKIGTGRIHFWSVVS